MGTRYRIMWSIDVEADNVWLAAQRALEIQRNPESIAFIFDVIDTKTTRSRTIDLLDMTEQPQDSSVYNAEE